MSPQKLYPESGVELTPFLARYYDQILNIGSVGKYGRFIHKAIQDTGIRPGDTIIDLGCGTGRNAALMLPNLGEAGKVTGVDLSPIMQQQFERRFAGEERARFFKHRIDIPFDLGEKADIIFISFVIHGFPHEVREAILSNVRNNLKPKGVFVILDYAEFDLQKMPWLHRSIFKLFECPYAFDFIERDWKKILSEKGFETTFEEFYFWNYIRLLKSRSLQ
ncbi:MAG: class I SAM-dependent methyltransferase [Bacteroidales bacterium]|nr:class I SAM-dependent methyltransferase [Bacteroidales bacterium]